MALADFEREELTLEKLEEVLKKFEPGESLYEFRNTAIYYSFKYNKVKQDVKPRKLELRM